MSAETEALVRKSLEAVFSRGNVQGLTEFFSPALAKTLTRGLKENSAAFPELRYKVETIISEGDKVAFRYIAEGAHKGAFRGIAPTNKPVHICGSAVARVADGKITELYVNEDQRSLMIQLGKMPPFRKIKGTLSGRWRGEHSRVGVVLNLRQFGTQVSGTASVVGSGDEAPVTGSVKWPSVSLSSSVSGVPFRFAGNCRSNRIDGKFSGPIEGEVTLRRLDWNESEAR
jgi:predicted ester cyclase